MKENTLAITGFELVTKRTRKRNFLDEVSLAIPWSHPLGLIAPQAPAGKTRRPPFVNEAMLRIHLLQQFLGHSGLAMEEALHDIPLYREFTKLIVRGLMLKTDTVVDATLIAAPSSTKNDKGERDPEMHQTKKGNQRHFGMKAQIGVDSGLVRMATTTPVNAHDMMQAYELLHGQAEAVFADSGYRDVEKRQEIQVKYAAVDWQIAMMTGKRKALGKTQASYALADRIEKLKAIIRAKFEHPFWVIKCQFGYRKTRYQGLAKNVTQLHVMFALSKLWMVRKRMTQGLAA